MPGSMLKDGLSLGGRFQHLGAHGWMGLAPSVSWAGSDDPIVATDLLDYAPGDTATASHQVMPRIRDSIRMARTPTAKTEPTRAPSSGDTQSPARTFPQNRLSNPSWLPSPSF